MFVITGKKHNNITRLLLPSKLVESKDLINVRIKGLS